MMGPKDIERLARDARVEPGEQVDQRILAAAEAVLDRTFETKTVVKAQPVWKIVVNSGIAKLVVAAGVLVMAFVLGRQSLPEPVDVERLRSDLEVSLRTSLEPAIRKSVLNEVEERWEWALASSCLALREELDGQARRDLSELARLMQTARVVDRRQLSTTLGQLEFDRQQDKKRLDRRLQTLAVYVSGSGDTKVD